jgi:hypothetical protein
MNRSSAIGKAKTAVTFDDTIEGARTATGSDGFIEDMALRKDNELRKD